MGSNYIPSRDKDFHSWFGNLLNYVLDKNAAWNCIPQSQVTVLNEAFQDWNNHYAPTLQPHTPGQSQCKNDARRRSEAVICEFVQRFLYLDPVTNEDRVNIGIPNIRLIPRLMRMLRLK